MSAVRNPLMVAALPLVALLVAVPVAGGAEEGQPLARPPDYARLALRGDGMKQDSTSLAIVAAARLLGGEADYATVCCLTSNASLPPSTWARSVRRGGTWRRARETGRFWSFVKEHVDAGRPILSEHLDGGLVTGYRVKGGERQVWFDGPVGRVGSP